jgi:hypothetical protein
MALSSLLLGAPKKMVLWTEVPSPTSVLSLVLTLNFALELMLADAISRHWPMVWIRDTVRSKGSVDAEKYSQTTTRR